MTVNNSGRREPAQATARDRIEQLLARYPETTDIEAQEIVRFLKKGLIIDIGMVTSNEALQAKLAQFRADHRSEFATPGRDLALFAALLAGFVLICWLLWDAGTNL